MNSKYQKKSIEKQKKQAVLLYKQGLPLRKVAGIIGKSHQWVKLAVDELDKNLQQV